MADAPMIFRFVGDSLSSLTDAYSEAASSSLAGAIAPLAMSGVTLFIAVYGALVIAGKIQQPFQDFMVKAAKIIIVGAVALNAGNYMSWVGEAVTGLESGLVTALRPPGVPAGASSTYEQLDMSIGKANELVEKCFDEAGKKNVFTEAGPLLGFIVAGLTIGVGIVIFFLVGGAIIVATKFLLAIMIAIGPLFILAIMFPATAGFFDRWLGQTLTYVFTIVLVAVVMSLGISIFDRLVASVVIDDSHALFVAIQILFVSLILAWVTMQIGGLASGISGGASMAALTLRQVAGIAVAPAKAATSGARMLNPISNRLDPRSGLQTSSSRLEHFAQGRSMLSPNPAYRNAVMERYRSAFRGGRDSNSK